jgi:hypothetical protein
LPPSGRKHDIVPASRSAQSLGRNALPDLGHALDEDFSRLGHALEEEFRRIVAREAHRCCAATSGPPWTNAGFRIALPLAE